MSLAERLESAPRTSRGMVCRVFAVLAELGPKDRDALVAALAVPVGDLNRISSREISEALKSEGFEVHSKTIETHRRGGCRCESRG